MLLEISIQNFAIIEEITLTFGEGMSVLTGETGAGKSIIIDAMNLMLGARASSDLIRRHQEKATIQGFFSVTKNPYLIDLLDQHGIPSDDEIIIRREIFQNGRSVSRINGQMVNLTVLRTVGQFLVDIHGQHDQEDLMKVSRHAYLLDQFGDAAFLRLKRKYQECFNAYRELRKRMVTQQQNEREYKARLDLLAFQIAEIEAVDLKVDEEVQLQTERDQLINHKYIVDTLTNAYQLLDNDDYSSLTNIRSAMSDLLAIEQYDAVYQDLASHISEAYYILEEMTKRLSNQLNHLDFDAKRLHMIDQRLDQITSLTRKYGGDTSAVLDYLENSIKEYQLLTGDDIATEHLEVQLKTLESSLIEAATALSQARHQLARQLEDDIKRELQDLYMEKAEFRVTFTKRKFNTEGHESIEFFISTNPGEDFKPLVKVASGGELSRLMLAIKSAFSQREDKTSIVFDEVDTGVSGRVAQAIAKKMHKIACHGQVLAISHLPQVIAAADHQFYITKESSDTRTVSRVRLLNQTERIEEIAKMLAGSDLTEAARLQAKELLKKDF